MSDHIRLGSDAFESLAAAIANVKWTDSTGDPDNYPPGHGHGKKRSDWLNDILDINMDGSTPAARREYRLRTIKAAYIGITDPEANAVSDALDAVFLLEGIPNQSHPHSGPKPARKSLWRRTYERISERCHSARLQGHQEIGLLLQEVLDESSGDIPRHRIEGIVAYVFPVESQFTPVALRLNAMRMAFHLKFGSSADENGY